MRTRRDGAGGVPGRGGGDGESGGAELVPRPAAAKEDA